MRRNHAGRRRLTTCARTRPTRRRLCTFNRAQNLFLSRIDSLHAHPSPTGFWRTTQDTLHIPRVHSHVSSVQLTSLVNIAHAGLEPVRGAGKGAASRSRRLTTSGQPMPAGIAASEDRHIAAARFLLWKSGRASEAGFCCQAGESRSANQGEGHGVPRVRVTLPCTLLMSKIDQTREPY